jgi:hypothetical protein
MPRARRRPREYRRRQSLLTFSNLTSHLFSSASGTRHRKSEKEEDEELIKHDDDDEDEGVYVYDESPACEYRSESVALIGWFSSFFQRIFSRKGRQDARLPGRRTELDGFAASQRYQRDLGGRDGKACPAIYHPGGTIISDISECHL